MRPTAEPGVDTRFDAVNIELFTEAANSSRLRFSLGARSMPLPTQEELFDLLVSNLAGPKSVTVDGQTVVARDAKDFLDALAAISAEVAAASGRSGLRFHQFVPPGGGGTG